MENHKQLFVTRSNRKKVVVAWLIRWVGKLYWSGGWGWSLTPSRWSSRFGVRDTVKDWPRWSSRFGVRDTAEARVGSLPVLVSYNLIPLSAESGLISKTFRQNFFKIGMRLQNAILRIRLDAVWPEKLYMLTYGGKWGAKTEKRNTIFG